MWLLLVPFFVALFAAVISLCAFVTQWAWNIVVAGVFHGPTIDFWQALGVYFLLSLIGGTRTVTYRD